MNKGIFGPPDRAFKTRYFRANAAAGAGANAKTWTKISLSKKCDFVTFILIGAGGPGGNGFTRTAGSAGGGGSAGPSAAILRVTFPRWSLPDVVWAQIPKGGTPGTVGGRVYISRTRSISAVDCYAISGAADAGAGGNGTGAAGGPGASAPAVATALTAGLSNWSTAFSTVTGQAGATGGAQTGAAGGSPSYNDQVSAGCTGAGCTTTDFAGGNFGASGPFPATTGGAAPGGHGVAGMESRKYRMYTGGTGGASNNSGVAGNGGNGQIGSGGGGGGAGATGGTGGRGGNAALWVTEH